MSLSICSRAYFRPALLAGVAVATISQPAMAQAARHQFNIPEQAASSSLQAFARQSGKQVLFPYDATRGRIAPRISGTYEDSHVLGLLANAAGLEVSTSSGNTVTLSVPSRKKGKVRPTATAYMAAPEAAQVGDAAAARGPAEASGASAAASTEGLEEIVVTAQRRTEDLQRAALSVTVRSGDELLQQGRYSLSSILTDVPGVSGGAALWTGGLSGSASGTDSPSSGLVIRGIPSNVGVAGSLTSVATSAAIYVDGIYNGTGGNYDISRVEVLRGPQGTLYGRSATTGLVAIHTRNPDLTRFEGDISGEVGNYDTQRVGAAINIPIAEGKVALRVSGNYYTRDGYVTNDVGGAITNKNLRAKLLLQPTDNFSLLFGIAGENTRQYSAGAVVQFVTPDHYVVNPNKIGQGDNKTRQYWAEANWDIGGVTLTYLPAFRTWTSFSMNYARNPALPSGSDQALNTPKDDFLTQELRFASNGQGPLNWQVGTLYYRNVLNNESILRDSVSQALTSSSVTDRTTTAFGVFGEATYAFTPNTRVTGGLRYDYTKVEVSQVYTTNSNLTAGGPQGSATYGLPEVLNPKSLSGDAGRRTFNNVTYKARLEHDLSPDNMVYLSTSTGVTPGDLTLTTGVNNTPTLVEFKAETLTSYEFGTKNRFLNNQLQINAAAFYYDYGGYQVANINISPIPSVRSYTTLSAPARVYGGELELLYRPTPNDRVGVNIAYTNAYFVDREDQVVPGSGGRTFDYYFHRSKIPGVVPFNAQVSYDHTFDFFAESRLTVRGDVRYLASYATAAITQPQDAAGGYAYVRSEANWLGNASATWNSADGRFMVSGYVRNVTNNRYKTQVIVTSVGTGLIASGSIYDPRTYGLVLGAKF